VGFDTVLGLLVRTNEINERCTGYSIGAGAIAWFLVFPIWFGMSWSVRLVAGGGRYFVVGRTLTGPRAVDLGELVSARRFQVLGRAKGSWDDLRLRDRHGVRLSADCGVAIEDAVRNSLEAHGVRVSKAVRQRLATRERRLGASGRAVLGLLVVVGSLGALWTASLLVTCLIAGTPFNG
jgi:hypothetical protein